MDRLWEAYRPKIHGKKRPLFVNLLTTTVVDAWKSYCQIGDKKITHIGFRRPVTLYLLKGQQHREIESSVDPELPLNVHFDGVKHFLRPVTTQGRRKVCKKIQLCAQNATFVSMGSVARLASKLIILAANA